MSPTTDTAQVKGSDTITGATPAACHVWAGVGMVRLRGETLKT